MQVLIADDDAVTRLILQAAIESLGHSCFCAENGLMAWDLFKSNKPDVLISDWMMPGLSGPQLCQRIRKEDRVIKEENQDKPEPHTRMLGYTYIIILTSLNDKLHLKEGFEAGADDYLVKPLNLQELTFRLQVAARITELHRLLADQALELERLNRSLIQQVGKDALTGLNNRLRLKEDLEVIKSEISRYGQCHHSAIMIDIDNFKHFNDTYGHQAGDEALKIIAQLFLANIRKEDMVYRYGGEEFLILLPYQDEYKAFLVAEKLRLIIESLKISLLFSKSKWAIKITISAGVAELTAGNSPTLEDWLRSADQALYCAKQAGRNLVRGQRNFLTELDTKNLCNYTGGKLGNKG